MSLAIDCFFRVLRLSSFLGAATLLLLLSEAAAFDNLDTHRRITRLSARASDLDNVLKGELLMLDGVGTLLQPAVEQRRTIGSLLEGGSQFEDDPPCRARNHFHNPLRPFSSSGITDLPPFIQGACSVTEFDQTFSSILWGTRFTSPQEQGPGAGNPFDWDAARGAYLDALILPTSPEREGALARTFETLGHVMHLVQDLAVPAHVRDDFQSHLQYLNPFAGFGRWTENGFERFVRRNPQLVDAAAAKAGEFPISFSRQRVTRFWDTDLYTGAVPSKETDQGLAEYTNANFASQYTILTESFSQNDPKFFPYPRESETNLQAVVPQALSVRAFVAEDNKVDVGLYITKEGNGQKIDNFARLGYLWSDIPPDQLRLSLQLDDIVNADYATLLLPRAIAYSQGLVDYFFRGKLDVDLMPADPNDPSVVRVSGANASTDVLRGGTLTLYADDPTDPTGKRDPAAALDQDLTVTAESGAPVESARFRVPGDTERFMVVYKGTLGQEAETGTFPGGVVGKVLGGVRVEEVFADGANWKVRTPKGAFLLQGLTTAEFEGVRWGDGESLLVARTPFGPGQPNRVAAYEVGRQPGSMELVTVNTPAGPEVPVVKKNEAAFPFGMSLNTTVEFSQTIQYKQLVPTFRVTGIYEYVPIPGQPEAINYIGPTLEFTPLQIGTPVSQTVRLAQNFPITLDLARHADFWTMWRPYVWYLQEVAASASGRLLGLILVSLTEPDVPRVSLPFYGLNPSTGPEVTGQVDFTPSFPSEVDPLLWAVVDLKEGRVVASTADAVITISTEEGRETFLEVPRLGAIVAGHGLEAYNGGPLAGVYDRGWFALPFVSPDGLPPIEDLTEVQSQAGMTISAGGWLRRDLKEELGRLGLSEFQVSTGQVTGDAVYLCLPTSCKAIRHITTFTEVVRSPATLEDARRSRPVPEGERVVFLTGGGTAGPTLLVWDPETPKAKVVHQFPASEGPVLGPATRATAMIFSFVLQGEMLLPSTMLIPLDGSRPPTAFSGEDLSLSFALLDQSYLYHVGELKFYRPKPPLQATALPARLADVPGNPVGDYHAIRLP